MIDVQEQMRAAVELFHYSLRFEDRLFVLQLSSAESLKSILSDLRVLDSSHINILICCPHEEQTAALISDWSAKGHRFRYCPMAAQAGALQASRAEIEQLLNGDATPVLAFSGLPAAAKDAITALDGLAADAAALFRAVKLFLFTPYGMLEADQLRLSYPTRCELNQLLDSNAEFNLGSERVKRLMDIQEALGIDLIILQDASGTLFREVFSHRGAGSLLTSDYRNILRRAALADFSDIQFIMEPYVQAGIIRPLADEEMTRQIENFFVFTVNEQIVALSLLAQYDNWASVEKLCTLPRYQRRGRARRLVSRLIDTARTQGRTGVFALSIEPKMWVFFTQLGFVEVERESLPAAWRNQYDFSRPSRAFAVRF